MKYLVSLLLGNIVGAAIFGLALYFNPFSGQPSVSPLAVTSDRVINLSFSAVPDHALLYTDDGESIVRPHPDRVAELWEPAVVDTDIFVTTLEDSRGLFAGLGIKMRSRSEQTALVRGQALANSVWHVYLPGEGTLMIDQLENYWSYLREVVIPAHWSSADSWRGSFHRVMTSGPGSLGTANVSGGNGLFAGLTSESVESLTASGYSASTGPASMQGSLAIAIPDPVAAQE